MFQILLFDMILGFEAATSLSDALDEIVPWIQKQIENGGI
jgi:hypothetical protein